jgi:DDE domain
VYVSARRDTRAARHFFATALRAHGDPVEVVTDRAWTLIAAVDELIPAAFDNTERYANNRIEADHGRLKTRLRPMHGLKRDRTARVIMPVQDDVIDLDPTLGHEFFDVAQRQPEPRGTSAPQGRSLRREPETRERRTRDRRYRTNERLAHLTTVDLGHRHRPMQQSL